MPYNVAMQRLALVRATPAQARALDYGTHAAWPCGLDLEAHVEKEVRLRQGPWPASALSAWMPCDADHPEAPPVASCELYEMHARVDGRPGRVLAFASVFVPPALRGRGHASTLLTRLHAEVGGAEDVAACILFSDVGAPIYERLGYVARPAFDRTYPPELRAAPPPGVLPLSETSLRALRPRAPAGPLDLAPTLDQLDWHLDRSRLRAESLGVQRPARCGAVIDGDPEQHIVWVDEEDELLVLTMAAASPEAAQSLVAAAQDAAARAGLACVRAWETPDVPWPAGARAPREGCLPMIRPVWAGVEPADWTWVPRALWV